MDILTNYNTKVKLITNLCFLFSHLIKKITDYIFFKKFSVNNAWNRLYNYAYDIKYNSTMHDIYNNIMVSNIILNLNQFFKFKI